MIKRTNPKTRSEIMASIKAVSKLETLVAKELWSKGMRFRRNVKSLKGTPDIAIKKYKIVIFIDSCFWHLCPLHGKIPKTNIDFWTKKLFRNKERDDEITDFYLNRGWKVMRIWEHEIRNDFENTIDKIITFIESNKVS